MHHLSTAAGTTAIFIAASLIFAACSLGAPEVPSGADVTPESAVAVADATPTPPAVPSISPTVPGPPPTPAVSGVTASPVPGGPTPFPVPSPAPRRVVDLLPEPPDRDLIALARRFGKVESGSAAIGTASNDGEGYEIGHGQEFFVKDLVDNTTYTIRATLQTVSANAYWYVDDAVNLSDDALRKAATVFEAEIRPGMVESLGDISKPGVDGDPRLTVLHTPLRAADGYFGSSDQYLRSIHPLSNEREMIYMDAGRLTPGTVAYLSVLAHEFQHAIHWNLDGGEDAWINEGMSELAKEQVGYGLSFVDSFLRRPDVQLNFWPDEIGTSGPHYGAASLFLAYLAQHYGGYQAMGGLVREQADGINGIELYLSAYETSFETVFKDWVVANYLDADEGPYGYLDRAVKVRTMERVFAELQQTAALPQFAARYYDLRLPDGDYLLEFSGNTEVSQVDTQCHSGNRCWWSGLGDSIDSMLTRPLDLTGLTEATLEFWTWYDIEEGWDYAYVSVSADGGETWAILEGRFTTAEDPVGNNFGAGFTGRSGRWVQESMDLSRFAGEKVLLRFEYVTDDAVNLDGFVVDDIGVPELGLFDDAENVGNWTGAGFQLIDNVLPQKFAVQIIEIGVDGDVGVREITLNDENTGEYRVAGFGKELENAVLVITPLTRGTFISADYSLSITAAGER